MSLQMAVSKRELKRKVLRVSDGVLSRVIDLTLISIAYGFEASIGGYSNVGLAYGKAEKDLGELNSETIKNSLYQLKRKGFIQTAREGFLLPKITEEGKKRIEGVLPKYDDKRVWDGRVYIITYDLPRDRNNERNILRSFLKKIGCGSLQYSVWMTPYNPNILIEDFINERNLENEFILISSLGKDGTIGNKNLPELIDMVYDLSGLNSRYAEFIQKYEKRKFLSKDQLVFSFLSIKQYFEPSVAILKKYFNSFIQVHIHIQYNL